MSTPASWNCYIHFRWREIWMQMTSEHKIWSEVGWRYYHKRYINLRQHTTFFYPVTVQYPQFHPHRTYHQQCPQREFDTCQPYLERTHQVSNHHPPRSKSTVYNSVNLWAWCIAFYRGWRRSYVWRVQQYILFRYRSREMLIQQWPAQQFVA